jgi:putative membrane protein
MKGIFTRWIISAISLLLTAALLPGIEVSILSAFVASAFLGVFNALLRPILLILTLPINILTLGLFTFVINGLMLYLVSGVIKGVEIQGFGWAVIGAALLSLIGWVLHALVTEEGRVEVIELKRGRDGTWRSS